MMRHRRFDTQKKAREKKNAKKKVVDMVAGGSS